MNNYKEEQFSWISIWGVVLILIVLLLDYTFTFSNKVYNQNTFLIFPISMIFILSLFYKMKTTVSDTKITIVFGIGLIRKSILLDRVRSISVVRNPWFWGIGIRIIPNGMLYNVHGLNAVEISYLDTHRITRVGTANPELLKKEIDLRLEKRKNQ